LRLRENAHVFYHLRQPLVDDVGNKLVSDV